MLRRPSIFAFSSLLLLASACNGDDGNGNDEVGDGDGDTTGDGDGDTTGDGDGDDPNPDCGNGILDEGEVCDDGNKVTEYPPYAAGDCIDDCSMVLATCNDGNLDPGEECDDGNADSMDACTTSCTINHMGVHAACTVFQDGMEIDPQFNVAEGDIQNCDGVTPVSGTEVGCNRSWSYIGNNLVYAAGGDCQMISLKCEGGVLCPAGPIGDYDAVTECPAGHVLIDKTIEGDAVVPTIKSRVCLRACESDRDCRWNEEDVYWGGPGEYRCQVTPLSGGNKVCNDGRNNAL
jgi:cysteine-rich repeat protein